MPAACVVGPSLKVTERNAARSVRLTLKRTPGGIRLRDNFRVVSTIGSLAVIPPAEDPSSFRAKANRRPSISCPASELANQTGPICVILVILTRSMNHSRRFSRTELQILVSGASCQQCYMSHPLTGK
jgi:hypothetical protein